MRKHHAPRADADVRGLCPDARDENFRRGARECAGRMMLGDPVTLVAEPIGESREFDSVAERVGGGEAGRNRALVDDRKFHEELNCSETHRGFHTSLSRGNPCTLVLEYLALW